MKYIFDIVSDKLQILKNIEGPYTFFGDKTLKAGNVYYITTAVIDFGGILHQLNGWKEIHAVLRII